MRMSSSRSLYYFYPRPPRGGRLSGFRQQRRISPISIHALREEGDDGACPKRRGGGHISIHALREEGDRSGSCRSPSQKGFLSTPSARRATCRVTSTQWPTANFYPRPPRGGRRLGQPFFREVLCISIHALREEGDSKNGEKHLRFCFIIKRSAQIWKSLSKNIRKKSRDLHRTA